MTNIDCSDVEGYQNLTKDDFIVVPLSGGTYNARGNSGSFSGFAVQSYNSSTGLLVYKSGYAAEYYSCYTNSVDIYV